MRNCCHGWASKLGCISVMISTTSVLPSKPPVAVNATQAPTLIQPVAKLMARLVDGQLMMATQWYCPPAVGYADRNSAKDAAKHMLQMPAKMRPQMTALGPPDGRARLREVESAVQLLRIANARPNMESMEKLR